MNAQYDADVLVIGAGAGGLTAAAYLAAAGKRVIAVDPGPRPGGHSTVFERDSYEFDIGLHYIGTDADGRPAPDPLLAPLGIDLAWNRVNPTDIVVQPDGSQFAVPIGVEAYRADLHQALPGERAAADRFVDTIAALERHIDTLVTAHGIGDLPAALRSAIPVLRSSRTTLGEVFDRLHCSPKARLLMGWIAGTYGLPPSQTPVELHALVAMHYLRGAWYPAGGGSVIGDGLAHIVRANGGQILLGHRATGIAVAGGAVTGIAVSGPDGPLELRAPVVVSDADIKHTYLDLLDPGDVPAAVRRTVRGYEMSLPLASLYTVIDRDLAAQGSPVTNYLVVGGTDVETGMRQARAGIFSPEPTVWITSASLKDPGNPRLCRPGQSNVQLMGIVPPQPRAWGLQVGVARGEAYRAAKQALRDRMVAAAERVIPGFGDAIVFEELATPYTFSRYTSVTDGTSYGIALTADQMMRNRPGPKTHIAGLYLAGASTRTGHGIAGVMAGGVVTASAVLGSPAIDAVRGRLPVG